jgi:signal transduction histidine kinase
VRLTITRSPSSGADEFRTVLFRLDALAVGPRAVSYRAPTRSARRLYRGHPPTVSSCGPFLPIRTGLLRCRARRLIADVVKTIEPLAAKNANQVAVKCDRAIGTLHADQMRLRQALLNLLSNANKFTEHGTITADARQGQDPASASWSRIRASG